MRELSAIQTTKPAKLITSMMEYINLWLSAKTRIKNGESTKVSLHLFQTIQEDGECEFFFFDFSKEKFGYTLVYIFSI